MDLPEVRTDDRPIPYGGIGVFDHVLTYSQHVFNLNMAVNM